MNRWHADPLFIRATLSQVSLPELTQLRRALLAWMVASDAGGLDEDGIVALFAGVLRDFRERRGAGSDETEGIA
jgi:hypothetical protein